MYAAEWREGLQLMSMHTCALQPIRIHTCAQMQGTNAKLFEVQKAFSTMDEDRASITWSYLRAEVGRIYSK